MAIIIWYLLGFSLGYSLGSMLNSTPKNTKEINYTNVDKHEELSDYVKQIDELLSQFSYDVNGKIINVRNIIDEVKKNDLL